MELHDYMKENYGYEMSLFRFPMGEFSECGLKCPAAAGIQERVLELCIP